MSILIKDMQMPESCEECKFKHIRATSQPEKLYTKADYIMALHKEYGCSLTRAEEAHNKALEYLQDKMMMKGGKNEH